MTPALELLDVVKRFGNVVALDRATLRVRSGTVHAVLGENGAGKTTLMRIAYGLTQPDAGTLLRDGRGYTARHPADAIALGIGMVQQHFSLVPAMSVAENVVLGLRGTYSPRAAARIVASIAEGTGLTVDPMAPVESLPISAQQRVEILKALLRDARVLILDEPTAVLAPQESEDLMTWMRRFVSRGDRCIVLITHKLREAIAVADDVTVLREGVPMLSAPAADVDEPRLVQAMIGRSVDVPGTTGLSAPGRLMVLLEHVTVRDRLGRIRLHDVTVEVRAGELVGVAAVEGAGQHEFLRLLAGRLSPSQGRAVVPGDLAFIPEDRHRDAVMLEMTLTENLALRGLSQRRGRMPWNMLTGQTVDMLRKFDVRASGPRAMMASLSGGNQQKFVVGRELEPLPSVLIAENPTRGLDIRATATVHERLRAARDAGVAVVVYSSDVDEVLELATRIIVVHAGTIRTVPAVREEVGRAMLGAVVP